MEQDDTAKDRKAIQAPGLLILTGPSHAGKTTLAHAVLDALPAPVALLAVDDVLEHQLRRPTADKWLNIPLAYEILVSELEILLRAGWYVVLESTFTYVPPSGPAELHLQALERILELARGKGVAALVAQVRAPLEVLQSRAGSSDLLDPAVVAETFALHEAHAMTGPDTHRVDTGELSPEQASASIIGRIAAPSRASQPASWSGRRRRRR